jgi:hypothetical protein
MSEHDDYRNRPPRRNAFPGVCRCGANVDARSGWVWKGGVYCRRPIVPNLCPKAYNEN